MKTTKTLVMLVILFTTSYNLFAQKIEYNGTTFNISQNYIKNQVYAIFGVSNKYESEDNRVFGEGLSGAYIYPNLILEFTDNYLTYLNIKSPDYILNVDNHKIKVGDNISILYKIPAFSQILTVDRNVLMFNFNPTDNSFIFEVSADRIMSISYFIPD